MGAERRDWVDTANVVWSEVLGLCGFWDGCCENGTCGAGTTIQVFTETLGWALIHKKCGPVRGGTPRMPRRHVDGKFETVDRQKFVWAISADTSPSLAKFALARGWTVTEPPTQPRLVP